MSLTVRTNLDNRMIIAKETLNNWNSLRERGDIPKLVKLSGLSRSALYVFLETGEYTNSTSVARMKTFFEQKAKDRATAATLNEDQD